jgi:histidinol-phosphate aminotransferase
MISENFVRKIVNEMPLLNWSEPKKDDIRLVYGENISGMSQKLKKELLETISKEIEFSNLYTVDKVDELTKVLTKKLSIDKSQIVIGNGIDDIAKLIFQTFVDNGDEIITIDPSYRFYENMGLVQGAKIKKVTLKKDFSLDIKDILSKKSKVVFIPNPNNPTGNILLTNEKISELCSKFNGIVVIDECYYGISKQTCIDLVKKHENLIVLRSFSKSHALAGIRLGYAIANKTISKYMNSLINNLETFRVNRIVASSGLVVLRHEKEIISKLLENKKIFYKKLKKIKQIEVYPSETTFFLVKLPISACDLKKDLEKHKIIIKDCSMFPSLGKNFSILGIPKKQDIDFVIEKISQSF